jgi:hypothetical protein
VPGCAVLANAGKNGFAWLRFTLTMPQQLRSPGLYAVRTSTEELGAYMLIMLLPAEARCAEMYLSPVSSSDIGDTPAANREPPPIPM